MYIQAQLESNNKDSDDSKKEELDDKDSTKEKDKKKKDDDDGNNDSWTKADQDLITKYNYRNLVIPKVYQTAPEGETYKFKHDNPNGKVQVDEEDKENIFTQQNKDGSWRIEYGEPRIDIHTKDAGILPDKPEQLNNLSKGKIQSWNYSELKDIGYWYKPSDWKNVEVTLIFKLLDSSRSKGEQHAISLVTRSISHSEKYDDYDDDDGKPPFYCGGSSYHNNISNEGYLRMKKEQYHVNYEWERYADTLTVGNIYDKIIGFKGILYNIMILQ